MNRHLREFLRKATAIVAIAALVGGQAHANPVTITQWTFVGDVLTPSTGLGTASNIGGTSSTFATGNGSGTRAWNTSTYPAKQANSGTAGVQFLFSTVGYENLTFSYDHRASGTGSRWAQLDYTLNGTDWITGFWNNNGGLAPHDTFYPFNVDLSSITGANNNANFGVRIVSIFSPQAFNENSVNSFPANTAYMRANNDAKYAPTAGAGNSTSQYTSTGTWRFDNVTLAGAQLPPPGAKDISWNTTSGTWSTSASNWTEGSGSTTFANADTVTFNNTAGGTITVDAGGVSPATTTISAASGTYTFEGGAIGGGGSLTKSGNGTAILASANTFGGAVNIDGGTLQANSAAALGNGTAVNFDGGTLRAGGNITGTRTLTANAGGATVDTNGFDVAVASIDGTGVFTKFGGGTLTTSAYSAAGAVGVAAGTLQINNSGATAVAAGGTINGTLAIGSGGRINFGDGTIGGSGQIAALQTESSIANTGSGLNTVLDVDIALNSNDVAGPFRTNIGTTSGNTMVINGTISGASDVRFSAGNNGGAGILTLNAANTYAGNTEMNNAQSGIVRLGIANALPTTTGVTWGVTQNSGSLDLNGFDQTLTFIATGTGGVTGGIANTGSMAVLTLNQDTDTTFGARIGEVSSVTNLTDWNNNISLVKNGTGKLTLTGSNSFTGGLTINAGTLSISADANLGGSSGGTTLGGGTLEMTSGFTLGSGRTITATANTTSTLAVTTGTVTFGGAFTGSGNLDKAGAGWLIVSNASPLYSGTFAVSAGTLEVTGSGAFANAFLSQSGGTLLLAPAGGGDVVIPDLAGGGGETTIVEGATAVVGGPGNSSYNGRLRGQGGLRKEGAGDLLLNGNNDFAGNTRIAEGRLKLGTNGALSATPLIEIDTGAIFDLTERASALVLGNGQRLGGRGSILGNLEFGSGSQLTLDPTQPNAPLLVGSGTISFAEGFGLGNIFGLDASTPEGIYTLLNEIDNSGSISSANLPNVGPNNPFDLGDGKSAYFQSGSLQVVVVPEPSVFLLGGLASAGLVVRRRRQATAEAAA
jgi:fibronectin-binding autotransporter adhesin